MSTVEGTGVLSAEDRQKFERDGYLVLDSVGVEPERLDRIIEDLDGLYEGQGEEQAGVFYAWHRIMDAWRISESVREVALSPYVHSVLRELYGREPLPFQTLNFRVGTEQPVHSDAIHFNSKPAGFMCGVWVALEDIDMDNGPLVYYPGTHTRPEIMLEDVGPDADEQQYVQYLADMIERENLEPAYGTIRKGQAIVWAANILHGGSPQRDKSRTRFSQVTHYFFEGCRYWTPIRSTPARTQWRDPVWVTPEPDNSRAEHAEEFRRLVDEHVPKGATVLVVSNGEKELIELPGRDGLHFPQDEDGVWLGYHPAGDAEALTQLERLKRQGAEYIVFPDEALWWLDHYAGLGAHLETEGRRVARDERVAVYAL